MRATDVPVAAGDRNNLTIYGREVFLGDHSALLNVIDRLSRSGRPELVLTPNVDHLIELEMNMAFREIYKDCALVLLDGAPLVVIAKMLGVKSATRNTGADLLPFLSEAAKDRSWRIGIAGGRPGVAAAACTNLFQKYGCDIAAIKMPQLTSNTDKKTLEIIQELYEMKCDIVFLCLGAPKQELWFSEWKTKLPPAVYIGAGAAVDFAAGAKRRAPKFFQYLGFEWLWRLGTEPKRLAHRYLVRGPRFSSLAYKSLNFHFRRIRRNAQ